MSDTAGSRWEEFLDICARVSENDRYFTDNDVQFVDDLGEKLSTYKDKTYISVNQINWLRRLEAKLEGLYL